jgi:hypothetical protein
MKEGPGFFHILCDLTSLVHPPLFCRGMVNYLNQTTIFRLNNILLVTISKASELFDNVTVRWDMILNSMFPRLVVNISLAVIFVSLGLILSGFRCFRNNSNPTYASGSSVRPHPEQFDSARRFKYDDYSKDQVVLNVLQFGAVGDGVTDDTSALRRTLLLAAEIKAGAIVLLPETYVFRSGPLNLTSQVTLQVDGTLLAWTWNTTNWPQIPPLKHYGNSRDGPRLQYQAFVYAAHAHNIRILGRGVIDGDGSPWWDAFRNDRSLLSAGRPNLIQLLHCQQVEIAGVTLKDSPFWTLHPVFCDTVHIHHIRIRSPMYAPNVDGIDPDSSRNILIEYNDISCGDDHIAIKAGVCGQSSPLNCHETVGFTDGTFETVNVTIRNNVLRTGMGIAMGSECSGGIRNVRVEDNMIGVCQPGSCQEGCCGWSMALHLKTTETRGGHMQDIVFRNNTINNTTAAIDLETAYQQNNSTEDPNPTLITGISFEGNRGLGTGHAMYFLCSKSLPWKNVSFVNNSFASIAVIECQNIQVLDGFGNDICHTMLNLRNRESIRPDVS